MPHGKRVDRARAAELFKQPGMTDEKAARELGCSPGYARLIRTGRVLTSAEKAAKGLRSTSRFVQGDLKGRRTRGMPPFDHPAIMGARTLYPTTVRPPQAVQQLLKPGSGSAKIGDRILKGKWAGFQVFTLTLEERATCPKTCHHWRSCFGNGMQHAHRLEHGPELERILAGEIGEKCQEFPDGVAIRLHVLGDFYSVEYVQFWRKMLDQYPNLVCFGFTARWDRHRDPIAKAVRDLVWRSWDRFAIRFSDAPMGYKSTVSVEHPFQVEGTDAIVCPEQLGKTESCGTCGLCWATTRPIAFVEH